MKLTKLLDFLYVLFLCAMISIGRFYDSRLTFFEINFSIIISSIYILLTFFYFFHIKKVILNVSVKLLFLFYFLIMLVTPILWSYYGLFETEIGTYGGSIQNFMNFILIVVPSSFLITQFFSLKQVKQLLFILLSVSSFLAIVSLFSIGELKNGRLVALGGGPIVFCRWMLFAILILLFFPTKKKVFTRAVLSIIFLTLALATGSRGPIFAFLLTLFLYFFLNFKRLFFRFFSIISIFLFSLFFTDISSDISQIGNTKRVFMNFSKTGFKSQSTNTRIDLVERSIDMIYQHPFGVGSGNWQPIANKINPTHLMNSKIFYPHNLFLEVCNEYGVFCGIILIIILIRIWIISYKKMYVFKTKENSYYQLIFFLIIFLTLNSLISGSLIDSRLLFIIISITLIKKPLYKVKSC